MRVACEIVRICETCAQRWVRQPGHEGYLTKLEKRRKGCLSTRQDVRSEMSHDDLLLHCLFKHVISSLHTAKQPKFCPWELGKAIVLSRSVWKLSLKYGELRLLFYYYGVILWVSFISKTYCQHHDISVQFRKGKNWEWKFLKPWSHILLDFFVSLNYGNYVYYFIIMVLF